MKKFLYLAAAITVMASCTSDNLVDAPNTAQKGESGAIVFGSTFQGMTRADHYGADAAGLLNNNFVVMGMKSDGTIAAADAPVFDHYNVNWATNTANTTTSNSSDWEYVNQTIHAHTGVAAQSIKYWDYAKSQYDFIAYSKGLATAVYDAAAYVPGTNVLFTKITPSTKATSAYTVKGRAADLAKVYIADLVTAYRDETPSDYNNVVNIKFRSLSAKVRVALYETVPGYSIQVSTVKFYSADDATPTTTATLYTKGSDVFNEEGTYTVYYPTTGSTKTTDPDYNKAHVAFTPATGTGTTATATNKDFGELKGSLAAEEFADVEVAEASGKNYLGRSSNTATYAGVYDDNYYTIVIPNETGAVLNLKVDYTLISTDGSGEKINVTGATAVVPAAYATWKSGYAYTYIFKISQNTNGYTGPDTKPSGLYPITFDATVVETEEGIQETITTVASPSITTYAEGKIVTTNNEYTVGTDIYISGVAADGTTSNAIALYVAELTGTHSSINEATAKLAYEQGKTDTSTDVYDKTEVKLTQIYGATAVTSVPAVDGNEYTVNAVKFTPTSAGTYVARYGDDTFKIIKVQ